MGKYDPLKRYLESCDGDTVEATFEDLERVLGFPLPESAYKHQAWWANESHGSHSHARSWQDAGWRTRRVNTSDRRVCFERRKHFRKSAIETRQPPAGSDLWKKAEAITGIRDRDRLIERALLSLIQHEAARALIRMGGSDPKAEAGPRERPWQ